MFMMAQKRIQEQLPVPKNANQKILIKFVEYVVTYTWINKNSDVMVKLVTTRNFDWLYIPNED